MRPKIPELRLALEGRFTEHHALMLEMHIAHVAGDHRRAVETAAIEPGRGPLQLIPGETRRMNLNDDIVIVRALKTGEPCRVRLGPLHERHPGRSRGLVRHHNRFHLNTSL
jgi:hypothetical protein